MLILFKVGLKQVKSKEREGKGRERRGECREESRDDNFDNDYVGYYESPASYP